MSVNQQRMDATRQRSDTVRRKDFAVDWLSANLATKIGKTNAYGIVALNVRVQAGEITSVKVTDEADYK